MHIYTDESGDLGWNFEPPFGKRGASRYLTIFAACVPDEKCRQLDRLVRDMYTASRWNTKHERKWTDASEPSRRHFAREAARLLSRHADISYRAIVVYKPNVEEYIRTDSDMLYNYMMKSMLLEEMARHDTVHLIPDNRSVKVASGNSLHEYLQTELWLTLGVRTSLHTRSTDSGQCRGLQFADFMAGAVNAKFEYGRSDYLDTPGLKVDIQRLYFPGLPHQAAA
ncbi:DUF3800 domain-containing protein [Luteibacter yeojuensis]|uniref:DUF3800 domain-containing protein n=1 Tax=Luteibacter yeojuensis TaxID=345309 RepID=A0A0F3L0M0_9GAMM|nr:DUF3800 domain-containing protein [Luteibacter yeojuensis]KJV36951.1 hypothetical protein VI08_01775 [Luteibacter yeojuensis]